MSHNAFLSTPEDLQWLRDTHLRGVTLPTEWTGFWFAILQGNEDSPYALNLYRSANPNHDDDYLRVTFDHAAPIYCEYDGRTSHLRGFPLERAP